MPKAEPPRVAVIGAGPIGLEAALYAKACGLPVAVYDRGGIAEHVRRWGHVRLFTPFGLNTTPLGLQTLLREKPNRDAAGRNRHRHRPRVPRRLSRAARANPKSSSKASTSKRPCCTSAAPQPAAAFRLLVRDGKGQERIDIGRCRARLHRHLRARPNGWATATSRPWANWRRGRTSPAGWKTSWASGRTTTRAAASRSSATATPPRRRSARWPRWRKNTRRRGCSGSRAGRAASRCRACRTTRSRSATASRRRPTRWPRAATATSNSTRRRSSTRSSATGRTGASASRADATASRCRGRSSA